MAFDIGPRSENVPVPPPEKRTLEDVLDFLRAAIVFLPLLALYAWWAVSSIWNAIKVGFGL